LEGNIKRGKITEVYQENETFGKYLKAKERKKEEYIL